MTLWPCVLHDQRTFCPHTHAHTPTPLVQHVFNAHLGMRAVLPFGSICVFSSMTCIRLCFRLSRFLDHHVLHFCPLVFVWFFGSLFVFFVLFCHSGPKAPPLRPSGPHIFVKGSQEEEKERERELSWRKKKRIESRRTLYLHSVPAMATSTKQARERGNELFKKKQYTAAVDAYLEGIRSNGEEIAGKLVEQADVELLKVSRDYFTGRLVSSITTGGEEGVSSSSNIGLCQSPPSNLSSENNRNVDRGSWSTSQSSRNDPRNGRSCARERRVYSTEKLVTLKRQIVAKTLHL